MKTIISKFKRQKEIFFEKVLNDSIYKKILLYNLQLDLAKTSFSKISCHCFSV